MLFLEKGGRKEMTALMESLTKVLKYNKPVHLVDIERMLIKDGVTRSGVQPIEIIQAMVRGKFIKFDPKQLKVTLIRTLKTTR